MRSQQKRPCRYRLSRTGPPLRPCRRRRSRTGPPPSPGRPPRNWTRIMITCEEPLPPPPLARLYGQTTQHLTRDFDTTVYIFLKWKVSCVESEMPESKINEFENIFFINTSLFVADLFSFFCVLILKSATSCHCKTVFFTDVFLSLFLQLKEYCQFLT